MNPTGLLRSRRYAVRPARHMGERGRTMLEMLIVIAIGVCLAALALPNVLMAYDLLRLNAAAMEFSGMIQRTRSTAVVQNAPAALRLSTSTFCSIGTTLWIDANANGTMDANEYARYCVSSHISIANSTTTLPASISDALLGDMTSITVNVAGIATPVYFNGRGLPCQYSSTSGTCNATISSGTTASSWVYYLYDSPSLGAKNWAAISITPAGRVRVWNWNGSAWK